MNSKKKIRKFQRIISIYLFGIFLTLAFATLNALIWDKVFGGWPFSIYKFAFIFLPFWILLIIAITVFIPQKIVTQNFVVRLDTALVASLIIGLFSFIDLHTMMQMNLKENLELGIVGIEGQINSRLEHIESYYPKWPDTATFNGKNPDYYIKLAIDAREVLKNLDLVDGFFLKYQREPNEGLTDGFQRLKEIKKQLKDNTNEIKNWQSGNDIIKFYSFFIILSAGVIGSWKVVIEIFKTIETR
ncbi:MAG: hypothetical protein AAF363_18330 [Bacteroidota bacterium]